MRDVVVVGASAGGVRALTKLVRAVPQELPAAILAVVHIPPDSRSELATVLDQAGPLPARTAREGDPLGKGRIYVAPPDHHLLVEGGRLRLTRGPRENRVRPCIDTLFRSAAVDLGPRVVGVVLSGALDDGTAGLWAVKDRGGVAVVQEPAEAEFPDMPQSALSHVDVDHVLPAAEIGSKLAALAAEPTMKPTAVPAAMAAEARIEMGHNPLENGVLRLGRPSRNACPECHGSLVEIREGPIVRYRCHTGHAYSLRTLLADTDAGVEKALWNAVRAFEERSFVLRTMAQDAADRGDRQLAQRLAEEADRAAVDAEHVRRLTTRSAA
jgi:two-component system chemotaxis response regulator CheB